MKMHQDAQGNPWFRQKQKEDEINRSVNGAHPLLAFQCKQCWFLNMEGCLPQSGCDDMYLELIRQANLDAIGGHTVTTTKAHAAAILRMVCNCAAIRKTPMIPAQGPCKLKDSVGMSVAVDMLYSSLVSVPRLQGESHIQLKSMRRIQATFTRSWISLSQGIAEGGLFSSGFGKTTFTACPTKQEWFSCFLLGCKIRMGYATKGNHLFTSNVIHKVLTLLKQEAEVEPSPIARGYLKVGAAIALATCASLRGPKVLLLDLAGLRQNIDKGKNSSLSQSPLKVGVNLMEAPHVIAVLLGNFKGKTEIQNHMIALASMTTSGIALRWWMEE